MSLGSGENNATGPPSPLQARLASPKNNESIVIGF
tara:strand:+ start:484 stop:588 length:105 start_codon:yes stop_codon:yes gene_type:complete